MASRVRTRGYCLGILPRQLCVPEGHLELVSIRWRSVDEEPDVVVHCSRDHLGRIEVGLGPGFGIPHSRDPQDFLPDSARGVARILAELQVARGHGPTLSMGPPTVRVQAGQGFPLRVIRVLAEQDLAAACDEQIVANAEAGGRELSGPCWRRMVRGAQDRAR